MLKLANITTVYRSRLVAESFAKWLNPQAKVLDVGCGTGVVAHELQKALNIKVTGCDIDKYLIVDIPFKRMESFDKLPNFGKKKFDACMFNDVLHHTDYQNQVKLLRQAINISKICLLFELKPTVAGRIADLVINKIHNPQMNIPYTYRTPKEWKTLFQKMGLKYEVMKVKKPFLYPFSHIAFRVTT